MRTFFYFTIAIVGIIRVRRKDVTTTNSTSITTLLGLPTKHVSICVPEPLFASRVSPNIKQNFEAAYPIFFQDRMTAPKRNDWPLPRASTLLHLHRLPTPYPLASGRSPTGGIRYSDPKKLKTLSFRWFSASFFWPSKWGKSNRVGLYRYGKVVDKSIVCMNTLPLAGQVGLSAGVESISGAKAGEYMTPWRFSRKSIFMYLADF